ncbi:MAG: DUF5074 domain-containing protein [Tannerella sp.]|jgi:hypothetical protein|nr:DUF5074 domain-containing protein [Tannerella sp.]
MKQTCLIHLLTALLFPFMSGRQAVAQEEAGSGGIFILNEDWFGHNNSSINFLNPVTGQFDYELIKNNGDNGNLSLGCTAQFGTVYGDNIYIISKQDQDPGERSSTGGRVVVADAGTMKIRKHIPVIAGRDGHSLADGRSFVGVDESKGYIGTSNGIYIFDLAALEIKDSIAGSGNPLITGNEDNADGLGALYRNQIGMMLRTHDYVFAIQQDRGVLVINPETDSIETVIPGCFSTMTQSKDGTVWVGKNSNRDFQTYPYGNVGSSGEKWEGNQLMKINPETLETALIDMPVHTGINQTWYAWTAGSLCASAKNNRLYFTFNPDKWSWFTCSLLYMYDIDRNTFIQLYDSSSDDRYFYGAGIRIHPLDDRIYAALYLDNISQSYFFYRMDSEGEVLDTYEPIERYWFPAMFIFPDSHPPAVSDFTPVTINATLPFLLDLSGMASDADNLAAAITRRVIANDRTDAIAAHVRNNRLIITAKPGQTGEAHITVRFNSNGKTVDKTLTVHLDTPSDIREVTGHEMHLTAENGTLRISGLPGKTTVRILNLQGKLLREMEINGTGTVAGLPTGQVYIVRAGTRSLTCLLKN